MTTIAVTKTAEGVMFAADEQTSAGNLKGYGFEKVFANGPVMFGVAGSVRISNLLRYVLDVPSRHKSTAPDEWVVRELIPAIRTCLEDEKALGEDEGMADAEMRVIVHAYGVTGYIDSGLSWFGQYDDYWSVGSGDNFALGAMAMGADAEVAVDIAKKFDTGTGGETNVWIVTREVKND